MVNTQCTLGNVPYFRVNFPMDSVSDAMDVGSEEDLKKLVQLAERVCSQDATKDVLTRIAIEVKKQQ